MNTYYHDFTIGFNFWMVFLVIGGIIMVIISKNFYVVDFRENGRPFVRGRYESKKINSNINVTALVMAIAFEIMFGLESWRGLIQFFDNNLAKNDDPMWSIFLALFAFVIIGIIVEMIFAAIGYAAASISHNILIDEIKKSKKIVKFMDEAELRKKQDSLKKTSV